MMNYMFYASIAIFIGGLIVTLMIFVENRKPAPTNGTSGRLGAFLVLTFIAVFLLAIGAFGMLIFGGIIALGYN